MTRLSAALLCTALALQITISATAHAANDDYTTGSQIDGGWKVEVEHSAVIPVATIPGPALAAPAAGGGVPAVSGVQVAYAPPNLRRVCADSLSVMHSGSYYCEVGTEPEKEAAEDVPMSDAGEPIVVTASDAAQLLARGSGLVREPVGTDIIDWHVPINVYTSPDPQTITTTILGTPVTITATPVAFRWEFDDGTILTTTSAGAPLPRGGVEHQYTALSHEYGDRWVELSTTWQASYSVNGAPDMPIPGSVTTTERSAPFTIVTFNSQLTDTAERRRGH